MIHRILIKSVAALCLLCAGTTTSSSRCAQTLRDALDTLDKAVDAMPEVMSRRRCRIDSLRENLTGAADDRRHILCRIAAEYAPLCVDSAISYYRSAIYDYSSDIYDTIPYYSTVIEYARQLAAGGYVTESYTMLDSIPEPALRQPERLALYDVRSRLYINAERITPVPERRSIMQQRARGCLDTLYSHLASRPVARKLIKARRLMLDGDSLAAAGELYEAMEKLEPYTPLHGSAAAMMAGLYARKPGRREEYLYYLALSATAEARNGDGAAFSMQTLGSEIYEEGDFDRALTYMAQAGEVLEQSGHTLLYRRSRSPMAVMLKTVRMHESRKDAVTYTALVLLALLLVAAGAVLYRQRCNLAAVRRSEQRSLAVSMAKDLYIAQLLGLCSGYIDVMQDFNRLVGRKIKANQVKDLYQAVESGTALRQMNEQFYLGFDTAVQKIYPGFTDAVNALLLPDKQIECPPPGRLTPELRIAAFIRLGVTESPAIAKFLGLSLNTVYTYRNRLRSRAKDREALDGDILKIGI